MKAITKEKIDDFISQFGEKELMNLFNTRINGKKESTLTIICDDTMHYIPESIISGEKFVFSNGSFDTSTSEKIEEYLEICLRMLNDKLLEREWAHIKVVFSGHAILAASVKALVYRVTHKETTDVIYFGSSGYKEIHINMRELSEKKASSA